MITFAYMRINKIYHSFKFTFVFPMVIRKFKITYVACVMFLLDSTGLYGTLKFVFLNKKNSVLR